MAYSSKWTVGIPTFNRSVFLRQALISIESQVLKPKKIIITDNNSTDETPNVKPTDPLIDFSYVRHSISVSPEKNFKSSLEICETQYFSWLQDDDYLFPSFGYSALDALEENPNAVAAIGYAYYAQSIERIHSLETRLWGPPPFKMNFGLGETFLVPKFCLIPWLTCHWPGFSPVALYRTEALREAMIENFPTEGYSGLLYEKYVIATLNSLGDIVYIPSVLGVLRQHGQNTSIKYSAYKQDEINKESSRLDDYLKKCLPLELSLIEKFFAENIKYFDASDIVSMLESLKVRDGSLVRLVLSWIEKYYPNKDALSCVKSRYVDLSTEQLLRAVARQCTPPIVMKLAKKIVGFVLFGLGRVR